MVTGRPNKGVGHVESLQGQQEIKERLRAVLETMTGELTVQEACARLGISPARFAEVRTAALQGALDALVPRPGGRPPKVESTDAEQVHDLEDELAETRRALQEAEVRVELADVLQERVERPPPHQKRGSGRKRSRGQGRRR